MKEVYIRDIFLVIETSTGKRFIFDYNPYEGPIEIAAGMEIEGEYLIYYI